MGDEESINIGIAARIKAAAPGGPRYDPSQTPSDRSSFENGIWLCSDHAHIIDADKKEYTSNILRGWKREAEERAFRQLAWGRGAAVVYSPSEPLLDELRYLRALLGLPAEADLAAVKERVRAGSLTQIEAFESTSRWPRHAVKLELVIKGEDEGGRLDLQCFP
jgi:hypothetical protein